MTEVLSRSTDLAKLQELNWDISMARLQDSKNPKYQLYSLKSLIQINDTNPNIDPKIFPHQQILDTLLQLITPDTNGNFPLDDRSDAEKRGEVPVIIDLSFDTSDNNARTEFWKLGLELIDLDLVLVQIPSLVTILCDTVQHNQETKYILEFLKFMEDMEMLDTDNFTNLCTSEDPMLRQAGAHAMYTLEDINPLFIMLKDTDLGIRALAISYLFAMGEFSTSQLKTYIADPTTPQEIKDCCISLLEDE